MKSYSPEIFFNLATTQLVLPKNPHLSPFFEKELSAPTTAANIRPEEDATGIETSPSWTR